jgi:hypothetical protein
LHGVLEAHSSDVGSIMAESFARISPPKVVWDLRTERPWR